MDGCVTVDLPTFGITQQDLQSILRKYLEWKNESFDVAAACPIHARVRSFATTRVGYLGDHFILELFGRNDEASVSSPVAALFLKAAPSTIPALAQYLQAIGTARKEASMYRTLLPRLARYSRFAPHGFYACDHPDGRALVLENLQAQGFRTLATTDAMGIFDRPHLECALRALAKFHSAALLLETDTGSSLPQLVPGLLHENGWIRKEDNPRVQELENAIDVLLALIRVTEKDNPRLDTILQKLPPFVLQIYELVKPSTEHRNVACHGDLWASNVMFRYGDDTAGRPPPRECLIIDFQFARYAPPAYDVAMLITLTTTGRFRRAHYNDLLEFYWRRMERELAQHLPQSDVNQLFPRERFLQSCHRYRTSALIDNFLMNHVTLLPRASVDRIFSSAECYNSFSGAAKIQMCLQVLHDHPAYRERLAGIIRDLIEAL